MDQGAFGIQPFSTEVDLWLECDHGRVELSQVGATFVIAQTPSALPQCHADIVMSIDGRIQKRRVELVSGMSEDEAETMVLASDSLPF